MLNIIVSPQKSPNSGIGHKIFSPIYQHNINKAAGVI